MERIRKIWTFCRREDWTNAVLWHLECSGDNIALDGSVNPVGFVCFAPIDSRESGFEWSRAWIEGEFPRDSLLRIRCVLLDEEEERDWDFQARVNALPQCEHPLEEAQRLFGPPISEGSDFLIPGSGRYLHLMIELGNTNGENPCISRLRIQMQADHMRDYLPEIYQSDDFTYRFLSIFDSMISDLEQEIDTVSRQLDKDECSSEMLAYLASWLDLDEGESLMNLRSRMDTVLDEYETMYSVAGIRNTISRLVGFEPIIIEGKDVLPSRTKSGNSETLQKLYGDNPYRFFVLLDEDVFNSNLERKNLIKAMDRYIPAGTEMQLVPLRKCVQLGQHTYLGVNTVLQDYIAAAIGESIGIHYDTIIGGHS